MTYRHDLNTQLAIGLAVGFGAGMLLSVGILTRRKSAVKLGTELMKKSLQVTETHTNAVKKAALGEALPSMQLAETILCVYMDYNATTPIYPEVSEAIIPFVTTCFGNPSSSHVYARPCRNAIVSAREQVGLLVNAPNPMKTIYFTSCGSESDNRAIDIALHHYHTSKSRRNEMPRIITSAVEHPAVLVYLQHLADKKVIDLVILRVNSAGLIDVADLRNNLTTNTALVTIMHSNNEVGTLMPIREISTAVQQFNSLRKGPKDGVVEVEVLFHSDGAQSMGKVTVDVLSSGIDLFTIVGHKFGAPKGVAALYIREGIR
jgi:cysteine desulfurase